MVICVYCVPVPVVFSHLEAHNISYMSRDMWFPTMGDFDMCRLRRAYKGKKGIPFCISKWSVCELIVLYVHMLLYKNEIKV